MKNKRSVPLPNECLLNNIIDKEFQATLYPLNIFQFFYFMPKFSVINNFITPKNYVYQFITSMIGATLLVLGHFFRFYHFYNHSSTDVLNFVVCLDLVISSIISILTHIVTNLQCGNSVEIIIRLQKVLNSIKIDKKRFLFKLKIENWISTLSIVSLYMIFWLSFGVGGGPLFDGIVSFLLTAPLMIYDLHMINLIRAIVFIRSELTAWYCIMEEYKKIVLRGAEDIRNDSISERVVFDSYVDIVKSLHLCNKVYQLSFTYFGFQAFIHVLINLEMVLQFGKVYSEIKFLQLVKIWGLFAAWNAKNFVLLITLSMACENFYRTVKMVDSCCVQIVNNDLNDHGSCMRKTCKNILRLNRAALRKLSAYGLFEIDAAFPARLLGVLVPYTVVLLQFALL